MKINELFLSIEGEGLDSGIPTTFIRTTGCNLRCKWCDTEYSYYEGEEMTLEEILKKCKSFYAKRISITGGEPLVQGIESVKLMKLLLKNGFKVQLQTNGSLDIKDVPKGVNIAMDIKCPASGMSDKILYNNLDLIKLTDSVIFVISDTKDYNFAKNVVKKYKLEKSTNVLFQPVCEKKGFMKEIVENILKDKLYVKIGLQLHVLVWGPRKKGV